MRRLLCTIALWVLWRWWPDRVISIVPPPYWNRGDIGWRREVTPARFDWDTIGYAETTVWEKLDLQGRLITRPGPESDPQRVPADWSERLSQLRAVEDDVTDVSYVV